MPLKKTNLRKIIFKNVISCCKIVSCFIYCIISPVPLSCFLASLLFKKNKELWKQWLFSLRASWKWLTAEPPLPRCLLICPVLVVGVSESCVDTGGVPVGTCFCFHLVNTEARSFEVGWEWGRWESGQVSWPRPGPLRVQYRLKISSVTMFLMPQMRMLF